jgi:hypothetical protein
MGIQRTSEIAGRIRDPKAFVGDWRPAAEDPVIAHLRAFQETRTQYQALQDDRVMPDDMARFDQVLTLLEADLELNRQRLEHTPPRSMEGMAALLRHALSICDDRSVAAVLKSCISALTGTDPQVLSFWDDDDDEDEPDEDDALWGLDG